LEVSSIAFEFISKPVDFDQLKEQLRQCLPLGIEAAMSSGGTASLWKAESGKVLIGIARPNILL